MGKIADVVEELGKLLNGFLPAYYMQAPAGAKLSARYYEYYATDTEYESGRAIQGMVSCRVDVFQRKLDRGLISNIVSALRKSGWTIQAREWLIDTESKCYHCSIDIDKWGGITSEINGT